MAAPNTKEIARVFSSIDDVRTMRRFFEEIFTAAEMRDMALRWQLMKLLRKGIPQREIASDLGVSLCKITRGSKVLKNPRSVSNKLLDRKSGASHVKRKQRKSSSG